MGCTRSRRSSGLRNQNRSPRPGEPSRYLPRKSTMTFDPTDWQTWTRYEHHPIFGIEKSNISNWSHDPSQYCDLNNYSQFMPEWYVHVDPPLPTESQKVMAARDIANLATSCKRIIERFLFYPLSYRRRYGRSSRPCFLLFMLFNR